MCGITGILSCRAEFTADQLRDRIRAMTDSLQHRGPDANGELVHEQYGLALGHRRLSILDLSPAGQQPMTSANERCTIVFNGEIYNHLSLRDDAALRDIPFRGHSDTETLVNLISTRGLQETLPLVNGMFAFAVWDHVQKSLTLVRDRLGIKPLYFGWQQGVLLFGSELKALRRFPGFDSTIDRSHIGDFLENGYLSGPRTIYAQKIFKLPPGFQLTVFANSDHELTPATAWWSAIDAAKNGAATPFSGTQSEANDALQELIADAVRQRCLSDVPLGAFLSGGIDSSLVVAEMQAQNSSPVKTFTIGFSEEKYNEAPHAAAIARHLGTDHTELIVTPDEAMAVIPELPQIFDEPFADSSQIPTLLVSRLARQHVTVSLSGDGGDEFFGGYNRYFHINGIWEKIRRIPRPARLAGSFAIPWLNAVRGGSRSGLWKGVLQSRTPADLYAFLNRHWKSPQEIVRGLSPTSPAGEDFGLQPAIQNMMAGDSIRYLCDDILTKVDRTSMAVSLEARVPLLDHRIIEFAWTLPAEWKFTGPNNSKIPLRELLSRHVPREMIERPKTGFGIPIDDWLRGPLRDWAEDLLSERRLNEDGYFFAAPIRQRWQEHLDGTADWHYLLWDVLMFQAWLAEWT